MAAKRKYARLHERSERKQCTKCKWEGANNEVVQRRIDECITEDICPKCGNNSFFRLLYYSPKPVSGGWISTCDKLPEKGERVLCSTLYGIQVGWISLKGHWQFSNGGMQFKLEYWMPLPELPKVSNK